jgi:hypothetical protein
MEWRTGCWRLKGLFFNAFCSRGASIDLKRAMMGAGDEVDDGGECRRFQRPRIPTDLLGEGRQRAGEGKSGIPSCPGCHHYAIASSSSAGAQVPVHSGAAQVICTAPSGLFLFFLRSTACLGVPILRYYSIVIIITIIINRATEHWWPPDPTHHGTIKPVGSASRRRRHYQRRADADVKII